MNDSAIFGMLGLLIGGAGVWAVMRARLSLAEAAAADASLDRDGWMNSCITVVGDLHKKHLRAIEAEDAHSRLSDAHNSTKERIERALECETANAAHGVRKMAAILRGER